MRQPVNELQIQSKKNFKKLKINFLNREKKQI